MKTILYHVFCPVLLILCIVALAALPADIVAAMGCQNRGLWAVFMALSSGLLGVVSALAAIIFRLRGTLGSERWALSAALFTIPVILLLFLA
jgi:hypothetical protein